MNTSTLISALALLLAIGTSACNTIGGAGADIESVGDTIDDAAEDARPN